MLFEGFYMLQKPPFCEVFEIMYLFEQEKVQKSKNAFS